MRRLLHYSKSPILRPEPAKPRTTGNGKPDGLWFSVEGPDDWPHLCASKQFGTDRLAFAHELLLHADSRILTLSSSVDVRVFTRQFKECDPSISELRCINWALVAESYQGIVIAPYQWSCRLLDETFWYYGWECASGCIWDTAAIAEHRMVAAPIPVAEDAI